MREMAYFGCQRLPGARMICPLLSETRRGDKMVSGENDILSKFFRFLWRFSFDLCGRIETWMVPELSCPPMIGMVIYGIVTENNLSYNGGKVWGSTEERYV